MASPKTRLSGKLPFGAFWPDSESVYRMPVQLKGADWSDPNTVLSCPCDQGKATFLRCHIDTHFNSANHMAFVEEQASTLAVDGSSTLPVLSNKGSTTHQEASEASEEGDIDPPLVNAIVSLNEVCKAHNVSEDAMMAMVKLLRTSMKEEAAYVLKRGGAAESRGVGGGSAVPTAPLPVTLGTHASSSSTTVLPSGGGSAVPTAPPLPVTSGAHISASSSSTVLPSGGTRTYVPPSIVVLDERRGVSHRLPAESGTTIGEVKERLKAKTSMDLADMRLIFAGRMLEDARTLNDYNISRHDRLYLVPVLRGG